MENIRIRNAALKLRGRVERTVGKLTGNKKLEAKGHKNHAAGSTRTEAGTTKDSAKDTVKIGATGDFCPESKRSLSNALT